jgi:hypothetical protein
MRRLIAVVALILAIAFLANKYLLPGGDAAPDDAQPNPAPAADHAADVASDRTLNSGTTADAVAVEAERAAAATQPAAAPVTAEAAVETDAEAEVADAAPAATVETDIDTQAAEEVDILDEAAPPADK